MRSSSSGSELPSCARISRNPPEPREDHASYLRHCLNILREDNRAIFAAAAHAQRAVDYLHSLQPDVPSTTQKTLIGRGTP